MYNEIYYKKENEVKKSIFIILFFINTGTLPCLKKKTKLQ